MKSMLHEVITYLLAQKRLAGSLRCVRLDWPGDNSARSSQYSDLTGHVF